MALKEIKPVFLIYGKERLLLKEAIDRLRAKLQEKAGSGFEHILISGGEISTGHLIEILGSDTLFSSLRLIIVDEADRLEASEELLSYLKNPAPAVHLVLMADKFDKRSRLYKQADKLGYVFEYKSPSRSELPAWIKRRFSEKGVNITGPATFYLSTNVDNDLMVLSGEIDKIILYNADKSEIDLPDIQPLITKSFESSVFELVESIGRRGKTESFAMLRSILARGQAPSYLYHMILRQFRLLLKTKVLLEKRGVSPKDLASSLNLPPFVASAYQRQSKNFTFDELTLAHSQLLLAEVDLKTGKKAPDLILEILIEKMIEKE